ncbi:MAG: MerR family transcriptional regulator [Rhodospirillaceae bacterium]|nr:MerR family transcriptional regulator [Rhodospirillaceae bacterium]
MIPPDDAETAPQRRSAKSEAAFRTISEVSEDLGVPQHVLRFWESKFTQIKPLKRGGGRRYYRPEDLALLEQIRDLLYKDGYTIRGAQKFLRGAGRRTAAPRMPEQGEPTAEQSVAAETDDEILDLAVQEEEEFCRDDAPDEWRLELESLLDELKDIRSLLTGWGKTSP